jgi:glycogen operon protein
VLSHVKLIAEPWDIGPDGYRLGGFPPGWAEWNGHYRDGMRSFWRGDEGALPQAASGLLGSAGLFDHSGRRAWASVNFITAHDGFSLADLVSYNHKHNEANLENNADGHDDNRSWNCGVEGPTDDAAVLDLRDRMRRNLMATLMLSQGTPMMLMGDEQGRSQGGNNNAYCQDDEISWLEWEKISDRDRALHSFIERLISVRRSWPSLRQASFIHGQRVGESGVENVSWLKPDATLMDDQSWADPHAKSVALLLCSPDLERSLILVNAHHEAVTFRMPDADVASWRLVVDTATGQIEGGSADPVAGESVELPARSLYLLIGRPS